MSQRREEQTLHTEPTRLVSRAQEAQSPRKEGMRKVSENSTVAQDPSSFCFRHQSEEFSVMRVYINALFSPEIKLYYSKFTPKNKKGTLCIVHGYGQNSGDYLETAEFFARNGFVVNMVDLRGCGYSGGSRVNHSVRGILSDIENLLTRCCQIGLPTYILCHGYGSLITFALLQENPNLPLAGVIALSPLLEFPNINSNSILSRAIEFLSPSIFDDILINNMVNPTGLTNNPQQIKKALSGVFNYQYVSLKMFTDFKQLSSKVLNDAYKFTYPVLICSGGQDMIQNPSIVKKLLSGFSSKEKKYTLYQQSHHQLHYDLEAPQIRNDILLWIAKLHTRRETPKWANIRSLNIETVIRPYYIHKVLLKILLIVLLLILLVKKLKTNWKKIQIF